MNMKYCTIENIDEIKRNIAKTFSIEFILILKHEK